jgi:hypothetical protein
VARTCRARRRKLGLEEARGRRRGCAGSHLSASARGVDPQVGHAGLLDLSGGRQTIQILAAAPDDARHDAGAISSEVVSSFNLSHGRAQFHGAAIAFAKNIGFGLRENPTAAPPARAAGVEVVTDTIEMIAPESGSVDTIEVVTVEPSGTKRKAKAKSKVVAAAPAVSVKRKPRRPRKATA